MKKLIWSVLVVMLLAAPLALAARPAPAGEGEGEEGPEWGAWWKNSEIVRHLNLSQAQVSQIEKIFLEHRLKLIDLHADVEKQETMLQPIIEADQPDEGKVSAQLDQLLAARARLEKANTMMTLAIRRTLSVEQWKKLQAIQEEREMRGRYERELREKAERQERERRERQERPPAPAPRPPNDNL